MPCSSPSCSNLLVPAHPSHRFLTYSNLTSLLNSTVSECGIVCESDFGVWSLMAQLAAASMATGHMHGSVVRPLGLGERHSGFFGTAVALPPRRMTVERKVLSKCVKAMSRDVDQKGALEKGTSWLERVGESVKRFSKPTMAVMLSLLLLESNPDMAFAASGGRVGGRVGGGSSFSSKSYSAPSRSYSAPSRSYSGPSMGGYGVPRQYMAPSPRFSYAVPYAAPSPFFGGGVYAAPAYGLGLGAGSVFFLLIVGFIILQAFYGFLSERSGLRGSSLLSGSQPVSVLKLQVGLLGMGRTLQRDLDRIAGQADTTTAQGLHHILTETCLTLMRHPDYCISGVTSSDINRSISVAEERFNNLSLEERGKFDEETLVNVNNLRKRMQMGARRAERFNNEYIVVTILVAAEGEYKLPQVNGNSDLKAALTKLGSIPADSIQAVEVLWTPQDENDTLSERELLRDYPLLRSL